MSLAKKRSRRTRSRTPRPSGTSWFPELEMTQPSERVPLILLVGFLGAGKTTVIRRWFSDFPMTRRRLGVVMNEFGPVSIDTLLVSKPDLPVEEVEGGCLCCASDTALASAATKLVRQRGCDLVVVEPSGLADPVATLDLLTDPEVLELFQLQAVVAVLDARAFEQSEGDAALWPLLRDQMRFADWILLSKTDVASEAGVARLTETCVSLNPSAALRRLPAQQPSLQELLAAKPVVNEVTISRADGGEGKGAGDAAAGHLHLGYRSLTFRIPTAVGRSAFEAFLRELDRREVVRAKGFVRFTAEPPDHVHVFQLVYGNFLIDEYPALPRPDTVAVLIGPSLDPGKYRRQLERLVWGMSRTPR